MRSRNFEKKAPPWGHKKAPSAYAGGARYHVDVSQLRKATGVNPPLATRNNATARDRLQLQSRKIDRAAATRRLRCEGRASQTVVSSKQNGPGKFRGRPSIAASYQ